MAGKESLLTIVVVSLSVGFFIGAIYYPLAAQELVWEDTRLGVFPHEPHMPMGGFTNEDNKTNFYELRVADTNATIYVMAPDEYNGYKNGTLAYNKTLSILNVSNTNVIVELPSNYTAWMYAGDMTDGSIYTVQRETVRPSSWAVFWAGGLGFLASLIVLSTITAIRVWND